jgi:16S rRNA (adenine1518-N6/adenine1519-N6)-dimethyltransferase
MGFSNGVKPKRSLGQNFFNNKALAQHIIDIVLESNPENITEIGPGTGYFTSLIHAATKNITVIEKDYELSQELKSKFPDISIYNEDFLDFKIESLDTTYFGSLPYNVSKPIIRKIITSPSFTNPSFFIIQKEVAQKYTNNEVNQLGLLREIYSECKILLTIKPDNFTPRPNVTSSFIKFIPHGKYNNIDKQELEKLIVNAFKQPRKTLKNNLRNTRYILQENEDMLRPDQLSLDQYVSILNRS